MIELTRLGGRKFVVNCDLIKYLESTPDTVISLTTGEKLMVAESVEEVVLRTMNYRWRVAHEPPEKRERS